VIVIVRQEKNGVFAFATVFWIEKNHVGESVPHLSLTAALLPPFLSINTSFFLFGKHAKFSYGKIFGQRFQELRDQTIGVLGATSVVF
jgi:hypothetical protein